MTSADRLEAKEERAAIIAALHAAGYRKVQDLTVFGSTYAPNEMAAAVPVAIEWLPRARVPNHRVALAKMLAGPHGRPAARFLTEFFRRETNAQVQEAIGFAIADMAGKPLGDLLPSLVDIVENPEQFPRSRLPIAQAVGRLGTPEALAVARDYVNDDSLGWFALEGFTRGGGRLSNEEIDALKLRYRGDAPVAKVLKAQRRRNARLTNGAPETDAPSLPT